MYGLTRKSGRVVVLLVGMTLVASSAAWACTGYPPTVVLLTPLFKTGTLWGGTVITKSAWGMLIVIGIKSVLFYWQSDLKPVRAVSYMFLGNVYSTIPAMLLTIPMAGSGIFYDSISGNVIFVIVVSFLIFLLPARSLVKREPFSRLHFTAIAFILAVLLVVAMIALVTALKMEQSVAQLILKLICGTASISIAFIVSIACEEGVISWLNKIKVKQDVSFIDPVFRVNAIAFVVMLLLFAGKQTLQIAYLISESNKLASAGL